MEIERFQFRRAPAPARREVIDEFHFANSRNVAAAEFEMNALGLQQVRPAYC
jgi:hypothetical protein